MSETPRLEASGHVPDLQQKMDWLLHARGGQHNGKKIYNQQRLAEALGVDPSQVTRWAQRGQIFNLPLHAPRIAEMFRCDDQQFRAAGFEAFVADTLNRRTGWQDLVAIAEVVGVIEPLDAGEHGSMHYRLAGPADEVFEPEDVPLLRPRERFRVTFPAATGRLRFVGWHVMAFCRDGDGYLNWLPRYRTNAAFRGQERVLSYQENIRFPALGGELKVGARAQGAHEIVVALSRDPWRADLAEALAADVPPQNLGPVLDKLGEWLVPRLTAETAKLLRRPFFVASLADTGL